MSRKPTVIVYGATAFTAGPLLPYLDTHPDADEFDFILAGRNKSKLDAASAKLNSKPETVAVELGDEEGVRRLIDKGDVVMNLAGVSQPFTPDIPANADVGPGPFRRHNAEALIKYGTSTAVCSAHNV